MKYFLTLLVTCFIIQTSVAPPITQQKNEDEYENEINHEDLGDVKEYHRYLQEVIQALESDPEFRAKLEKAKLNDIRSGNIAEELRFVNHHVRGRLDELKRIEHERLKHYYKQAMADSSNYIAHKKLEHINSKNPHTFEIEDLKKLIAKTAKDLDEANLRRKKQFKQYEMHKKFDQEQKMKEMNEEDKKKYEDELHDLEKKHKDHAPLHHPGSKKQLEEVWEKQDHMENQQFDPRTFFYLHDLDGNGVWDQDELKALFLKELDKLYAEGHPEDDLIERAEEMERMREHVIKEVDLNQDGLISYEEFLTQSKKEEFEADPGWEPLDEKQIYSEQEYERYRQQRAKEMERTISQGMSQDHHVENQPQAGQQQFPAQPNQLYQDHVQQVQYQNQVPQYNNHIPLQNGQYNQIPVQQGQFVNQMPQQQQFQPNQVPVQQNQQPPPNINVMPQQVPVQQQFQQPPPNINAIPQQQLNSPVQPQQSQPAVAVNNVNQQSQPVVNAVPLQKQQIPVAMATGHDLHNTLQVPQQAHEQIASMNNGQVHLNSPIQV